MITIHQLKEFLKSKYEDEHLEFKEMKNEISITGGEKHDKKSLLAYVVGLANEGGGTLILGVSDKIDHKQTYRTVVGTNAISNILSAKKTIFDILKIRIEIDEFMLESKRVLAITIPSRPASFVLRFYGIPLMRIGENLEIMDDKTLKNILMEENLDYSAETIPDLTIEDLDESAIEQLKKLWIKKSKNKEYKMYSTEKVLKKLLLLRGNKLTKASILLLGKPEIIGQYIPQAEIILEWRTEPHKINFDFKKIWRDSFLKVSDEIWDVVGSRNSRVPFQQNFIENDIWSYDQKSVREAVLNAFAHREYRGRTEPVFIKLSPLEFAIKSPGGFLPGVNSSNALFVEGRWRNRLIMETLHEIGLVERSGVGLDRVFMTSIKNGKGTPIFEETSDDFIKLSLPTPVQDDVFISYLENVTNEKNIKFGEIEDLIEIEYIRKTGKYKNRNKLEIFLKNGIIESVGTGRGTKYFLAKSYYEHLSKKGLNMVIRMKLLRKFFKDNKFGNMDNFKEVFNNNLDRKQIQYLLEMLQDKGEIYFDPIPSRQKGYWKKR